MALSGKVTQLFTGAVQNRVAPVCFRGWFRAKGTVKAHPLNPKTRDATRIQSGLERQPAGYQNHRRKFSSCISLSTSFWPALATTEHWLEWELENGRLRRASAVHEASPLARATVASAMRVVR